MGSIMLQTRSIEKIGRMAADADRGDLAIIAMKSVTKKFLISRELQRAGCRAVVGT